MPTGNSIETKPLPIKLRWLRFVRFLGSVMLSSETQFLKVLCPISVRSSQRVTFSRAAHPSNTPKPSFVALGNDAVTTPLPAKASFPTVVTDGKLIVFNEVQFLNVPALKSVISSRPVTVESEVQFINALSVIVRILSEKAISLNDSHPSNADLPILATFFIPLTDTRFLQRWNA